MQLRRLPTLIAVIDSLERRLCGGRVLSDDVLSDQELLDFLQVIGRQYADTSTSNPLTMQRLQLETEIQQLLKAQPTKRVLSIRHTALLQLTEIIFRLVESSGNLHSHVYSAIQGLQISFVRTLVHDSGTFIQPNYPYKTLLEFLVTAFAGYDQYSGRRAQALLREAGRRVAEILTNPSYDGEIPKKTEAEFAIFLHNYNRESGEIYEKNLISREHGDAARDDVRSIVSREILTAVGGRSLPTDLLRFFQEVWSKYLHVTYLREGPKSDAWQQGISIIPVVVRSLYVTDLNEMYYLYNGELTRALAILHEGTGSIQQDSQLTESVLNYLDKLPSEFIREGKKPYLSAFQDVPLPVQVKLPSSDDLEVLKDLNIGAWFIIHTGEQDIRGKLIQKDKELGYCLFASYSGMKAARLEVTGLAEALAKGTLRHIDNTLVVERAMERSLMQLESQVQRLKSKVHLVEQERANKIKSQKPPPQPDVSVASAVAAPVAVAEDATELKRLREEIRREETEARERERKAVEEQAQARELAENQEKERILKKILEEVNLLQPGGWLELLNKDNAKLTCKLGLKLRSTQKMIFVDRLGQKVAEMKTDELAVRIVEGSARIIDRGVAFEDTLQSLISDHAGKINVE